MISFITKKGYKNYWLVLENDHVLGYIQKERIPNPEILSLSKEELHRYLLEDSNRACREKALYYLSRSSLSEYKLSKKLEMHGFSPSMIAEALSHMKEYGYIDDEKLITMILSSSLTEGAGEYKIKNMLFQRGFSKDLIEAALSKWSHSPEVFLEQAISLLEQKNRIPTDQKSREKAFRFLAGRGFSLDVCKKAISHFDHSE